MIFFSVGNPACQVVENVNKITWRSQLLKKHTGNLRDVYIS